MTCVRASANVVIGAVAVLAAAGTSAAIAWRASSSTIDAGFWWDDAPFAVSADDAVKIGGPITADELTRIQRLSRGEVERAYQDLRVTVTDHHDAFWRISVIGEPITINRNHSTYPFAMAGQSHVFGPLGGFGSVGFLVLAHNAIEYAPDGASRAEIVDGIGRGIGRAAVHELAHQALGTDNLSHIDNRSDEHSYEYSSADRSAQYYGTLRWTTAWPVLAKKFGK
ncbi:MAG: hypothetical protein DMF88_13830 [Acidobacteria bacterium]|nr:MAG: hypothetical protein DMF88_13830 [Acidobacteriota bacterium]